MTKMTESMFDVDQARPNNEVGRNSQATRVA